ncbi:MAG: Fic family protein [Acidimicrobiia bacterium]|nr:Fic family protein [Acidimicrobiia bacterium]
MRGPADAERALVRLNTTNPDTLRPLGRLLLRTESIASSRIEGLHADARQLARAEVRQETGARVPTAAGEVLGNVNGMTLAIDDAANVDGPFTIDHLCAIHQRLMSSSPTPRIAGEIRTVQNWIGGNDHNPCGATFVPPPPEHVATLLQDLCTAINDDRWPPVIQAAIVHAQFETIHPFVDGNGRTGRALVHVVLRRRGITPPLFVPPISVVFGQDRDRYIKGLTWFRDDRVVDWVESFSTATIAAVTIAEQ